ncbi:MAG: phosphatidylcholine/phosphatidylserine synthase [Planctomycetes bacterium]|nr:phosphatidylcholine/phosphatidylserine synthase [Planctomycetota bacterium]
MAEPADSNSGTHTPESGRLIQLEQSGTHSGSYAAAGNTGRRRRAPRMPGLAVLPSMLTLGNALCGVAAMIELMAAYAAVLQGDSRQVYSRLGIAALLIGGGMLCDALDGKVARMTATTGRFGAELDSLCDAVTFGVTPALMIRVAGEFLFAQYDYDSRILWAISGLYVCCALLRLARFNVETAEVDDHTTFKGLPSPAAAASICALVMGTTWFHENVEAFRSDSWRWVIRIAFPIVGGAIGLSMVTRVRYVHLFNKFVSRKQSLRAMVLILVTVATVVIFREFWQLLLPAVMLTYVASGPVYFAYRFLRGRGVLGRRMEYAERLRQRDERARKAATATPPGKESA